jgi:protein-S-isoprenylcysteine O-methyltransferase Ste14
MDRKIFIAGLILPFALGIVVPLFLILLNIFFNLPKINFGMFKLIGLVMVALGLLVLAIQTRLHLKTGRITPVAIEAPKKLIMEGLHQYTRNPMYLAFTLIFLGLFIIFGYLFLFIYLLVAILAFHLFVVYVEEPELKKIFGEEYQKYCKNVPRWIPRRKN